MAQTATSNLPAIVARSAPPNGIPHISCTISAPTRELRMNPVTPNVSQAGAAPEATLHASDIQRLLTDFRQDFSASADSTIEQFLSLIEIQLQLSLDSCANAELRKTLQAAQQACREAKQLLGRKFRERFLREYELSLSDIPSTNLAALSDGPLSLTLVDDVTMEEDLLSRNFEWHIAHKCADALVQIDRRMPTLVGESKPHPLSPRLVVGALRDACRDVFDDPAIRLAIFKQLNAEVATAFEGAYTQVQTHIVAHVPEPRLRAVSRKERHPTHPVSTGHADAGMQGSAAAGSGFGGGETGSSGHASSGTPLGARPAPATAGGNAGGLQPVSAALLQKLDALIARHEAGSPVTSVPLNPSTGLSVNLESMIQRLASSPVISTGQGELHNFVRDIKVESPQHSLAATESIIVDVVAMMFDYIFDDPDIPAEVKGVIGRLQMPVLKIALVDKSFFANKRHPARHLVDRIAELADDYRPGSPECQKLFIHLNALADTIQANTDAGAPPFEDALRQLDEYVRTEEKQAQESAARIAQAATQSEDLEQRKKLLRASMLEKLAGKTLPMKISHFILNQWVEYLITLQDRRSTAEQMQKQDALLDDLIWSVTPKHSEGEQALLTRRLGIIVEAVTESLQAIGAFPHEQQQVLEALRSAHLENLKRKKKRPNEPVPEPATENGKEGALPPADTATPAPSAAADAGESNELPALPDQLQKGALLDFHSDGNVCRARLTWVSPSRSKFVFTSHAMPAFGLSASELADELESRGAVIVALSGALMDRVVEKAINAVD